MDLSIIQISSDLELPRYKFIVWNSESESNVGFSKNGQWSDWDMFCKQVEYNYKAAEENYDDLYPGDDDSDVSEYLLASELLSP